MKKKALVIGAARSGVAAAGLLARQDWDVTLSDLQKPVGFIDLPESIRYVWGNQNSELLQDVALIVISPGVPLEISIVEEAKMKEIEIIGELELFYRNCDLPILAVTGTNGKTTTTLLLAAMMEKLGSPVILGGNIGKAISEEADQLPAEGWVILEVSSYQLETIQKFKPYIAGILNITPDHLERHKTVGNYQKMKENIFKNQTKEDILILNDDDPQVSGMANKTVAKVILFDPSHFLQSGIWGDVEGLFFSSEGQKTKLLDWSDTVLPGMHNRQNIALAAGMAYCAGVSPQLITEAVREFRTVEHRIEWVREISGVDVYNDSKATNPDSAIKGLLAFDRPIVWLAGGYDKGNDLAELFQVAKEKCREVIFFGQSGQRFYEEAKKTGVAGRRVATLKDALLLGNIYSRPGDVLLLSPGCSSFDEFKDYEDRGRLFKKWVEEL